MRALALRASPLVLLAVLASWAAWDVSRVSDAPWNVILAIVLLLGLASSLAGLAAWGAWPRRVGCILIPAAYLGARTVALGIDLIPALAFTTLAVVQAELRVLADRFAPLYERSLGEDTRRAIDAAIVRQGLRLLLAFAIAILLPVLAADLALTGALRPTTIPSSLLLTGALIAVVSLLAILPAMRKTLPSEATQAVREKPN